MMKRLLFYLSFLVFIATNAQTADEVVQEFFTALSDKDTETIGRLTLDNIQLHSLMLADSTMLTSTTKEKFISGLKSIPAEVNIEERIFDITSLQSDHLAQFEVPYEFYVNGSLSHSGTNVLTLLKTENGWRISYVADTRN